MVKREAVPQLTIGAAVALLALFGLLLHLAFWHFPLDALSALTTPEQDERFSDPNYYLFKAAEVCRLPQWSTEDLMVTWSSIGVVGYLSIGCRWFGSEFFYVLANPILAAAALGIGLRTARSCDLQPNIGLMSVFAVPYTLLTISLPGKEVISVFGVMLVASGLLVISARRRWLAGFARIVPGIALVAMNRPHEAAAIGLFATLWMGSSRSLLLRVALPVGILAVASTLAPVIFSTLQLSATAETLTDESLWSGSSEGKAIDADGLFAMMRSDNLAVHALLGVARVAVVLAAPLSSVLTPWADVDAAYFIFRDLSQRLRLFDLAFLAFAFVSMLRVPARTLAPIAARTKWLFPSFFLFMVYVIVFFGVAQKSRYVFQYVPLILLWYWCWRPVRAGVNANPTGSAYPLPRS